MGTSVFFESLTEEVKGRRVEENKVELWRVYPAEQQALKEYVEALYEHDDQRDSLINISEGVESLLRNEALATPYFIGQGSERVGYVILTRYHSVKRGGLTIFIDELFVEPKRRRGGIGRQIMKAIIQIAQQEKAKAMWAQTEPFNEAAQAFFLGQGFRPDGQKSFERPV